MKSGWITDAQAELLSRMGQQFTLSIGAAARDFLAACELPNDAQHFHAALMSMLETILFLSIVGSVETLPERRKLADELTRSLKRLLLTHYRDTHRGPNDAQH